jgi:hypothetical protein
MKANTIQSPSRNAKYRITSALALSLAGAFLLAPVSSVSADEAKTQTAPAATAPATTAPAATEKADMKVSHDGFAAMRAIHDARMAIFNGEPKHCTELLKKADEALAKASKDESVVKVKEDMIPIDGNLGLADTFVPTEEKAKHIAKANEHFQKGESKKGLEELKLGEIDVNFSRVLMSLGTTKKRLADAEGDVKEQKYYECNLALKAAEDAVVIDSVNILEFPKPQGKVSAGEKKAEAEPKK